MRGFGNGRGRGQFPSNNRANVFPDRNVDLDGGGRTFQRNMMQTKPFQRDNQYNQYDDMDMDMDNEMGVRRYQRNMMQSQSFGPQRDNFYGNMDRDVEMGGRGDQRSMIEPKLFSQSENQSGALNIDLDIELLRRKRELLEKKMLMDRSMQYGGPMGQDYRDQPFERRYQSNQNYNNSSNYYDIPNNYRQPPKRPVANSSSAPPPKRPNRFKYDARVQKNVDRKPAITKNKPQEPKTSTTPKGIRKTNETKQLLKENEEPTAQMRGRMEYALGLILKQIKQKYEKDQVVTGCLQVPFIERIVKGIIRDRITKVMLNKEVNNFATILAAYRERYPLNKEEEIMKILNDEKNENDEMSDKFIKIDDPKKFFRVNMMHLLEQKVDEMLFNLEKLYYSNEQQVTELIDELPDIDTEDITEEVTQATEPEAAAAENTTDNTEEANGETDEEQRKAAKFQKYAQFMDSLIEERLPKMFVKYRYNIVRMLSEKDFKSLQADLVAETKHLVARQPHILESASKGLNAGKIQKDAADTAAENAETADSAVENTETADSAVENTETADSAVENTETPGNAAENTETDNTGVDTGAQGNGEGTSESASKNDTYHVVITGQPTLPSKLELYRYLNKFNPSSVKNHRSKKDLLVVGLNDAMNYEKLLEETGIIIGKITLVMQPSQPRFVMQIESANNSASNLDAEIDSLQSTINDSTVDNEAMECGDVMESEEAGKGSDDVQEVVSLTTSVNAPKNVKGVATPVRTSARRVSTKPGYTKTG